MRNGSRSLGEFPSAVGRVDCERCDGAGSYRRDGLIGAPELSSLIVLQVEWAQTKYYAPPDPLFGKDVSLTFLLSPMKLMKLASVWPLIEAQRAHFTRSGVWRPEYGRWLVDRI